MIEQILQNMVTMVPTQGRGQWKKKKKNWTWKDISRNKPALQKHSKWGSNSLTNLCSKHLDQEKMLQTANEFIKKNITSKFKGVVITQGGKKYILCIVLSSGGYTLQWWISNCNCPRQQYLDQNNLLQVPTQLKTWIGIRFIVCYLKGQSCSP